MSKQSTVGLTREDRRRRGREARAKVRRVDHADWNGKDRKFDLLPLLRAAEQGRIPKLLSLKHERMAVSPFSYFRGSVPVMAADLAELPRSGLTTQLCGDAHVRNLGAYAGADGRLIFDINDFDESIRGPWEWDVKRMATSIILAGREAGNSDRESRAAVLDFACSYREAMNAFAQMPIIDLARYQVLRALKVSPVMAVLRKAERATNLHNRDKLTVRRNGAYVFRESKPVQYRVSPAEAEKVKQGIRDYVASLLPERRHFFQQYQVEDVAFRVVGTGSIGLRDYVALMFGTGPDDPLFLQVKEERSSAYARYLPEARVPENQGERAAEGQRSMLVQSDIFLGWTTIDTRDYLVRQLRDHKAGIADQDLAGPGLVQYSRVCGELLAKGHARSGDPCSLHGYMGFSNKFDKAIGKFAITYADQTTADYEAFVRAHRPRRQHARKAPAKASRKT